MKPLRIAWPWLLVIGVGGPLAYAMVRLFSHERGDHQPRPEVAQLVHAAAFVAISVVVRITERASTSAVRASVCVGRKPP